MNFQPAIKWSGSKRSQSSAIVSRMPRKIGTYYEPFCGGCSVLRCLLDAKDVEVGRYVASDSNADLIFFWRQLRRDPAPICDMYSMLWEGLNRDEDLERKKRYFAEQRQIHNAGPYDAGRFFFIMRTCTNGMPRYNSSGDFNNSFHVTRPGVNPETAKDVLEEWNLVLNGKDVEFRLCDFRDISPAKEDFVYADPPYAHTRGMYHGGISPSTLFKWLEGLPCAFALSYDGKSGTEDFSVQVPERLFVRHEYIKSGNSSFRRVIGKNNHADVYESLYVNDPTLKGRD